MRSYLKLSDYEIDSTTGFLPHPDPLTALPAAYRIWDAIGANLPALLLARRARAQIAAMPMLDIADLEEVPQLERAMLLLSTLASAYVWAEPEPATQIPASLAVPLWAVAERIGRKPIIGHASNVLQNWRRISVDEGIELENLALLQPFLSSSDEAWFVLVTVAIEAAGAMALPELVRAQTAVIDSDLDALGSALRQIATAVEQMSVVLMRMYERCDPRIFYLRVRPFFAGWKAPGVIYEGVSDTPIVFAGGSAGQSSLVQSLDAALGVRHLSARSSPFLSEMRHYMPPAHRRFVEVLEQGPDVHTFVQNQQATSPTVVAAYNYCIDLLTDFRRKHMEIAVRYITMQAAQPDDATGTGGTSLTHFLGATKQETRAHRIGQQV